MPLLKAVQTDIWCTIHFAKKKFDWSLFRWMKQEAAAFNDYTYGVVVEL
jgi:hypothetical protein